VKLSRETKIGLVSIVTVGLFIWGLNFLKGNTLFQKQRNFFALYGQVDGLVVANPVNINGFKIGQVTDIHFVSETDPTIAVEFVIDQKIQIPKNSLARIYSQDLLGAKAIEIKLGNALTYAQPGDTLVSSIEQSLREEVNKQVEPIRRKAENLISSIDSMVVIIQYIFNENMRDNLLTSINSLKNTFVNLESTTQSIDTLVISQKRRLMDIIGHIESITRNLDNSNEEISNIISNFSAISDTLARAQISQTLENANKTLSDITSMVNKINTGQGTLGQLVNDQELYNHLVTTSGELNLLLEDMRLNPSRYVQVSVFGKNPKKNPYTPPVQDTLAPGK
jgi:phospholipid/cholesterol/gamma-HCH transport system substrate-binding protein